MNAIPYMARSGAPGRAIWPIFVKAAYRNKSRPSGPSDASSSTASTCRTRRRAPLSRRAGTLPEARGGNPASHRLVPARARLRRPELAGGRRSHRSAIAARRLEHLPRVEVVVDIADKTCGCCGAPLHTIGEDRSEMLDYAPAQLRIQVIRRPRYGCRACEGAVVQAPAPERPIDGGLATEALVAHVLVNKYADHLPLYRQLKDLKRQGVNLDRSTLCNWVGRACWWLEPLYGLVSSTVLTSPKVVADDTTLPVLDR